MRTRKYPLSPRLTRLACAVCLAFSATLAHAQVDQAVLEKAETLLKAGSAEEAYQLLEPLEVQAAGDPVYDSLLGTAALESKRPSKATFVSPAVRRCRKKRGMWCTMTGPLVTG